MRIADKGLCIEDQGRIGVEGGVVADGVCLDHCLAMCMVIWSRKSPGLRAVSLAGWMKRMMPLESVAIRRGKSVAANWARVAGGTIRVGVPRSCSAAVLGGSGGAGSLLEGFSFARVGFGGPLGGAATGGAGCARRA